MLQVKWQWALGFQSQLCQRCVNDGQVPHLSGLQFPISNRGVGRVNSAVSSLLDAGVHPPEDTT